MTDYLVCCFTPASAKEDTIYSTNRKKFAIRNIDKSMIGLPTNFQHCTHIGCSDMVTPGVLDSMTNTTSNTASTATNMTSSYLNSNSGNDLNNNTSSHRPLVSHLKLIDLKVA